MPPFSHCSGKSKIAMYLQMSFILNDMVSGQPQWYIALFNYRLAGSGCSMQAFLPLQLASNLAEEG